MIAARIRPSAMEAIEACPGRPTMEARACAQVPGWDEVGSAVADQGTMAHAWLAQTLALTYHQPGGWILPDDAQLQTARLAERMAPWARDAARRCYAYAVQLVDQATEQEYDIVLQIEMHLPGKGIDIGRGGTADFLLICRHPVTLAVEWVVVMDAKTGFLDQGQAADHLQLGCYAVMAYDKHKPRLGVEVHLAQGRLQDWSAARYDQRAIEAVRSRIRAAVAAAHSDADLRPSIKACRYAKCLPFCAAARRHIMQASDESALFGIDPANLVRMDDAAKVARRFAEQVKDLQKLLREQAKGAKA